MKSETQALGLAEMMQSRACYPVYELALPLVAVRSSKLKKLSVDDVILTGFDTLAFVLIEGETICANAVLGYVGNTLRAKFVNVSNDTIGQSDNKKYKTLKFSFGTVQSNVLELEHAIDVAHIDLEQVSLVSEGKTIAKGTLVNVGEEIAIQIKKVIT